MSQSNREQLISVDLMMTLHSTNQETEEGDKFINLDGLKNNLIDRTFSQQNLQTSPTTNSKLNLRKEVLNLIMKSSLLLSILLLVVMVAPKDLKLIQEAEAATFESNHLRNHRGIYLKHQENGNSPEFGSLDILPRSNSITEGRKKRLNFNNHHREATSALGQVGESNSIHTPRVFSRPNESTGKFVRNLHKRSTSSIRLDLGGNLNGNDELESEENVDDGGDSNDELTEVNDHHRDPPAATRRRQHKSNGHQIAASSYGEESRPEAEGERELRAGGEPLIGSAADERENVATGGGLMGKPVANKLHVVKILAPEAVQNGTQNVTIDCMFKFDRKLDERLTIKWFFNDEVEPIYQWIPELNKRVYSDKYERFLDKSYQVNEDVDFMLQAYKWLTSGSPLTSEPGNINSMTAASEGGGMEIGGEVGDGATAASLSTAQATGGPRDSNIRPQLLAEESRRLLASKLNKLANLGGKHSRQLIDSLRSTLAMEMAEFSRFRALRLLAPTTELSGRFTCSVSSLDSEDLRSTRLVVYEPAKSFNFNVTRVPGSPNQYRLACRAAHAFPRPSLSLYRYRAGPAFLEVRGRSAGYHHQTSRPKLAATQLRQELIPGTQTQLTVSGLGDLAPANPMIQSLATSGLGDSTSNDIARAIEMMPQPQPPMLSQGDGDNQPTTGGSGGGPHVAYEITAWVLVDEASLSSNLVTQFECHLSIEGTNYEQRQSLALQRGWHVNPAALTATRYTLVVGLLAALAALLCLMLALIKFVMIQRKLRQRATIGDLTQHHRNHQSPTIQSRRSSSTTTKTSGISITRHMK